MLTTGPVDRALILTRIAITVLMACGFYIYFQGLPVPWWLVAGLSVSLALMVAGVLLALDSLPAEQPGQVLPGRWRR